MSANCETAEFKVRVILPQGIGADQMAEYIRQSVQSACGGLSPDDLLFNLDREGVAVEYIQPAERKSGDSVTVERSIKWLEWNSSQSFLLGEERYAKCILEELARLRPAAAFYDTVTAAMNGLYDVVRQLGGPIESVPRDKAVDAFIATYCNMRQQLESERRYVESRARRLVPNAEPGRSFGLLMDDIESEVEKLRRDLVERDRAIFRCLESVAHALGAGQTPVPPAETEGFNDGSSYGIDHHDV